MNPEYTEYVKCMEFQGFVPMTFAEWVEAKEYDQELKDRWSLIVD